MNNPPKALSRFCIGLLAVISAPTLLAQSEPPDYPTLQGQFAAEIATAPLVAVEAFIDDHAFYVRYEGPSGTVYSGGEWKQRIPAEAFTAGEPYTGPYILPLSYHRSTPWPDAPANLERRKILSQSDWQAFRDRLLAAALPKDGNTGIVLQFQNDDYFLYYDATGTFHARPLIAKPPNYEILKRITFSEFLRQGAPLLEIFLAERHISDRRIVFNTGDTGLYSLPFLSVNLDLKVAVFARHGPQTPPGVTGTAATPYVQTAGHFVRSHTLGIALRPVSSLFRLFFMATDTVVTTLRPDWLVQLDQTPIPPVNTGAGMDLVAWEKKLDSLTGRNTSRGQLNYLVGGEAFFTRFIDAVVSAEDSIHLRTYIFDNDDYANKIGNLLKRRSNEGVDVKLLLDGFGTIISTAEKQDTLPTDWQGNESVRRFLETDSNIDVRQADNPWFSGDHVKTIVIDHRLAFTGGMNIAREYRYDWHDLMVEVRGPVVDILRDEFHKAWAHAGILGDIGYALTRLVPTRAEGEPLGYPVRALHTRTGDPEIFKVQRRAIRNAQRYIYVENAYFTDDALLYELARARKRGVDVRVIVPLATDRGPITRNNALAANAMLEQGIRVFIYPGMSHVKAAVFDGWVCLGSANWDNWSLRINNELNLATSEPAAADALLEQLFRPDFEQSVEITAPFPERWSDFLLERIGDYVF
jgi:cardiolipin synthase